MTEKINIELAAKQLIDKENCPGWQLIPCSEYALVARHSKGLFLKCFLVRNFLESIKALFKGDRCQRSIKGAELLLSIDLLAPDTVSCGRYKGIAWFASKEAAGVGFGDYVLYRSKNTATTITLETLLTALGRAVGKMHGKHIVHGDLRPNNIIVDIFNDDTHLSFIDNERTRKSYFPFFYRERKRNLVQLMMFAPSALSDIDKGYFFSAYGIELKMTDDNLAQLKAEVLSAAAIRLKNKRYEDLYPEAYERAYKKISQYLSDLKTRS